MSFVSKQNKTEPSHFPACTSNKGKKKGRKKSKRKHFRNPQDRIFHPRSSFECFSYSPQSPFGGHRLLPPGLTSHDDEQTEPSAVIAQGAGNAASRPSVRAITFKTHYLQFRPSSEAVVVVVVLAVLAVLVVLVAAAATRALPGRPHARVSAPARRVEGQAAMWVLDGRETAWGSGLWGGVGCA